MNIQNMNTAIMCYAFPGFCGTRLSEADQEIWGLEALMMDYGDLEHLGDWELAPDYRTRVCKEYAERYVEELSSTLGISMELIGFTLRSPREYNFSNDQIRINIEVGDWEAFVKKVTAMMDDPEYRTQLAGIIKTRHTSRSGFWSWMSNEIEDWYEMIEDPESVNYIGCILWYLYCLKSGEEINGRSDWGINDQVYEYLQCNTDVFELYPATEAAQDEWEEYQEREQYLEMLRSWPTIPGLFKDE